MDKIGYATHKEGTTLTGRESDAPDLGVHICTHTQNTHTLYTHTITHTTLPSSALYTDDHHLIGNKVCLQRAWVGGLPELPETSVVLDGAQRQAGHRKHSPNLL